MQLLNDIDQYALVDAVVAKAARIKMVKHLWSLTPEYSPVMLFSDKVSHQAKESMITKLLECKPPGNVEPKLNRFGVGYGKPKFPNENTISDAKQDISALLNESSWLMFKLLDLEQTFLSVSRLPIDQFCQSPAYKHCKHQIKSIKAVNDCAERGVKLCADFIGSSKNESMFQYTLQTVEEHRSNVPNLRSIRT